MCWEHLVRGRDEGGRERRRREERKGREEGRESMVHILTTAPPHSSHSLATPTCTWSGRVAILSLMVRNMRRDMCSAVNPMDPTRSGRPHDPMNRVSPVKA